MNVSGFISGLKQKVRDRETRKANDVAVELAQLKKDRVRVEGQKKLYSIRASEISKTKKAKSDLRMLKQQSSVLGRAIISIQKDVKDNKKKGSKKKMTGSDTFFKNDSPNAWFPIKDNKKKGSKSIQKNVKDNKKKGSKSIQKNVKDNKKKGSKKKMTGSDTFFKNDSPNAWFPK